MTKHPSNIESKMLYGLTQTMGIVTKVKQEARLETENERLRTALRNLIDASSHMSPFNGEASVAAVRRAGKYMEALEAAKRLVGEQE